MRIIRSLFHDNEIENAVIENYGIMAKRRRENFMNKFLSTTKLYVHCIIAIAAGKITVSVLSPEAYRMSVALIMFYVVCVIYAKFQQRKRSLL